MKASGNVASDESDLFKALMAVQDAPLADQLAVVNSSVPSAAVWLIFGELQRARSRLYQSQIL